MFMHYGGAVGGRENVRCAAVVNLEREMGVTPMGTLFSSERVPSSLICVEHTGLDLKRQLQVHEATGRDSQRMPLSCQSIDKFSSHLNTCIIY